MARVLQAAYHSGFINIPYRSDEHDPRAVMNAGWAEVARAFETRPSVRDLVASGAPMARGGQPSLPGGFSVKVERLVRPREARPQRLPQLPQSFDGFAGGLRAQIDGARDARHVHGARDASEARKHMQYSYER